MGSLSSLTFASTGINQNSLGRRGFVALVEDPHSASVSRAYRPISAKI